MPIPEFSSVISPQPAFEAIEQEVSPQEVPPTANICRWRQLIGRCTLALAMVGGGTASGVASEMLEPDPSPAAAIGGERAGILLPFDNGGRTWLANEGPGDHHHFWGAWSGDFHAAPGTAVKPRLQTSDGELTMSVAEVSNTCSSPNYAGQNVRVNVSVDGTFVGQVIYGHLNNVQVKAGDAVGANSVLGQLKLWGQSSCWQDTLKDGLVHTHVEVAKGCYRDLSPWTNYNGSTPFGLLSSAYGTGNVSECDEGDIGQVMELSNNSPVSPPDVRVPVAGDFDGELGDDLFASSERGNDDISPNLLVFPSTGGWLGSNRLWSAPSGINWGEVRLTAGDVDGDGRSDLLAIQNRDDKHPNIYWLRSEGNSFAPPQLVGVPGLWFDDVKEWVSGDFTGDGHDDLLAVSERGHPDPAPNLVVFRSTGGWLGGSELWGAPGELDWEDVVVIPADVDNDGKDDLLSVQPDGNGNPNIYWSRSTGSSFETPRLVGVPGLEFNRVNNWAAGNFDGQLGTDLLATSQRGDPAPNLVVFPSTGNWLGSGQLWGAPGQISWATSEMVPADLDGDGLTDLLSVQDGGNNTPNIWWSRSTGSNFASPQLVGAPGIAADKTRWQS